MTSLIILISAIAISVIAIFLAWVSRYKRCPSDKVLVVYGKTSGEKSARIIQGGAVFVWPIFQDYAFLDLKPLPIPIKMGGALSKQNIRVNIQSNFTIAISKDSAVTHNAANRLLGMQQKEIIQLSEDIITGQMRLVIATMDIEQINSDREMFLKQIQSNVETELSKVGLTLLNVNISDIQDESGYIKSLGQEAASKAINDAKVSVAEKTRDGDIGEANANQEKIVKVSQSKSLAEIGEAEAVAKATEGKNISAIKVAESDSLRASKQAEANARATAAQKIATANADKESYAAEQLAEEAKAEKVRASLKASTIVPSEIAKEKAALDAEAEAEKVRRVAQGNADGIYSEIAARAKGELELLNAKAAGYERLVKALGSSEALASVMMLEKIENIAKINSEAIKNIKFDKITVWDSGNSTGDFIGGLLKSLPPISETFKSVGMNLPAFLQGKEEVKKDEPKKLNS